MGIVPNIINVLPGKKENKMPTAKEAKKIIQTETKIMSAIEKIMDKIVDKKMRMRIANWIYFKYYVDEEIYTITPTNPTKWPSTKPAYPYIPNPVPPIPNGISAYAAPPARDGYVWNPGTPLVQRSQTTCNCDSNKEKKITMIDTDSNDIMHTALGKRCAEYFGLHFHVETYYNPFEAQCGDLVIYDGQDTRREATEEEMQMWQVLLNFMPPNLIAPEEFEKNKI